MGVLLRIHRSRCRSGDFQDLQMRRTTLHFILDSISLLNLLLLATTGTIMRWVLPPGSGGGYGRGLRGGRDPDEIKELLGLPRHAWGDIHFTLALLFVFLILVHVLLHWTWIKTCAKSILSPSHKASCGPENGRGIE
jgi:hypothetical protein